MDDADTLAAMYYGGAPDADSQRQAMAAALRRNQQQQAYGTTLQGLGKMNPAIGDYGQASAKDAEQRYTQLLHGPEQGANAQEALLKLSQANRMNAMRVNNASPMNQYQRTLMESFGAPKVPEDVNPMDLSEQDKLMAERFGAAGLRADATKAAAASRGGSDVDLTPEAVDMQVEAAHVAGKMPSTGRDRRTQKILLNAWAVKYPQDKAAIIASQYEAGKHELTQATTQQGQQSVLEDKALGEMQLLGQSMAKIPNFRARALNHTAREFADGVEGDPEMSKFAAQLVTTTTTIAQAIAGNKNLAHDQREEARALLPADMPIPSLVARMGVLVNDVKRSGQATKKRVTNARAAISGQPAGDFSLEDGAGAAPQIGEQQVQFWRSHLKPGQKLIIPVSGRGNGLALNPGEKIPAGYHEVPE